MGCIQDIAHVILNEFGEFCVIFGLVGCDDLQQARAWNARFIGYHENEEHVFIHGHGMVII